MKQTRQNSFSSGSSSGALSGLALMAAVFLGAAAYAQMPDVVVAQATVTPTADAQMADGQMADALPEAQPTALPVVAKMSRQETLITSLSIFVLAVFVGFEVITKVPPTLHTPLMSGSNAISGITLVGAFLAAGSGSLNLASFIGLLAVVLATINVVGGFLVTHRMLAMFKRR